MRTRAAVQSFESTDYNLYSCTVLPIGIGAAVFLSLHLVSLGILQIRNRNRKNYSFIETV
jgi:hypothetical protein